MPTSPLIIPPTPARGRNFEEYKVQLDIWTRKVQQAIQKHEEDIAALGGTDSAASGDSLTNDLMLMGG